jgi:hypothetical protein
MQARTQPLAAVHKRPADTRYSSLYQLAVGWCHRSLVSHAGCSCCQDSSRSSSGRSAEAAVSLSLLVPHTSLHLLTVRPFCLNNVPIVPNTVPSPMCPMCPVPSPMCPTQP